MCLLVFGAGADSGEELLDLVQGSRSVTNYTIDFCTRVPLCDWNPVVLRDVFILGLAGYIKDEIVALELLSSMEGLFDLFTHIDQHYQVHIQESRTTSLRLRQLCIPPHPQPTVMSAPAAAAP